MNSDNCKACIAIQEKKRGRRPEHTCGIDSSKEKEEKQREKEEKQRQKEEKQREKEEKQRQKEEKQREKEEKQRQKDEKQKAKVRKLEIEENLKLLAQKQNNTRSEKLAVEPEKLTVEPEKLAVEPEKLTVEPEKPSARPEKDVISYEEQAESGALKLKLIVDHSQMNGAGRATIQVPSFTTLNKVDENVLAHQNASRAAPLKDCKYTSIEFDKVIHACSGCSRVHVLTDADEKYNNGIPNSMDHCEQCEKLFCLNNETCSEHSNHVHCN